MQPAFMQVIMHSQQAWHMAAQCSSPLVQVMQTPIFVSSHSHLHIDMEHWHSIMPFIMQQQLHKLPAIILHMFCKVAAATSSSQVQVIFMPPLHFSIFMVHRGTMHICMAPGPAVGMGPAIGLPRDPIMALSIIIMLVIPNFLSLGPTLQIDQPAFAAWPSMLEIRRCAHLWKFTSEPRAIDLKACLQNRVHSQALWAFGFVSRLVKPPALRVGTDD
ncbi:MAG TPA: hypothetical protein VHV08_08775 [Pirellulales bacterium]|jgi:hypothetical protein|nr:hypothetical protein [Pirellulales bacterium]